MNRHVSLSVAVYLTLAAVFVAQLAPEAAELAAGLPALSQAGERKIENGNPAGAVAEFEQAPLPRRREAEAGAAQKFPR
jgi:hypothetical protein